MKKLFTITTILIMGSTSAFAKTFTYKCECTENNNGDKTIQINEKKVVVTNLDYSYGEVGAKFTATLDTNYNPRPSHMVKVRYLGEEASGSRQVIVQNTIIYGAKQGYIQIRGDEDGYWSSNFTCKLSN